MFYVYSTLTCPNVFVHYAKTESKDLPIILKKIMINGGHGVATKHFVTPKGAVTEVSDADMEILNADFSFNEHIKSGHIVVEKKKSEPEKIAKNMNDKDGSSPLTPEDFEEGVNSDDKTKVYKTKSRPV